MQTKSSPAPSTVSRNSWPKWNGYRINAKHHTAEEITALLNNIQPSETINGCWQWEGETDRRGNPIISHPKRKSATRIAYVVFLDSEPLHGYRVIHECENRQCLNPDHLTLEVKYRKELDFFKNPYKKAT